MKYFIASFSVIFALTIGMTSVSLAQDGGTGVSKVTATPTAPNGIFLELGGSGILYSLNYDRFLNPDLSFRIGFGYIGLSTSDVTVNSTDDQGFPTTTNASVSGHLLMIPATINYFLASHDGGVVGSSKFELGAGPVYEEVSGSLLSKTYSSSGVGATVIIGYRYQPADGGFLFRAALTPTLILGYLVPMGGLSFGFSF